MVLMTEEKISRFFKVISGILAIVFPIAIAIRVPENKFGMFLESLFLSYFIFCTDWEK